jgi:hypothetical protein
MPAERSMLVLSYCWLLRQTHSDRCS